MEFNDKFLNSKNIMSFFVQNARRIQCYELSVTPKTSDEIIAKKLVSFGNMGENVSFSIRGTTVYSFMSEKEILKSLEKTKNQHQIVK